nr:hypothetical protein [Tanacetum cinerariifolium]
MEIPASIALVTCDGRGGYDWSDQVEEEPNYALKAYTSSTSDSKIVDNCKKGLGYESYNAVLPPYIGNFRPPKPDLSFTGLDEFVNKPEVENSHVKFSEEETKVVRKNVDAPIIEEWVSDDEEGNATQPKIVKKTVRPSIVKKEFVKPRQHKKTARKTVKQIVDNCKKGLGYESYNAVLPPYIVNFMPPKPDLSFTGLDEFVNKPEVENSHVKFSEEETKVVRKNVDPPIIEEWVSDDEEGNATQPKIGNPQMNLQDKRMINSGCSRHMTGNMSYLTDYKEIDGGYVAFGGNPKRGKITGKCTIKTATKDETSGILKSFIIGIENLVDQNFKVIRCDNETEFKNSKMIQFCEIKGILRQFSVARTPQQKEIAERRNKTLIEATRTMLADSKLSTTFWTEAVNTACYVQNRVLVVRPQNKTSYTILNTKEHLGKFDGTADEGFLIGYSLNSKAFRVFNSRTRIVKENLHIRFSESTPNVVGSGPDWLFDIDALTRTMNYEPIKKINVNSTNNINTVSSTVNVAGTNRVNVVGELPFDPNMPALEDVGTFDFSNEDEDDDEVADMSNLNTTIQLRPKRAAPENLTPKQECRHPRASGDAHFGEESFLICSHGGSIPFSELLNYFILIAPEWSRKWYGESDSYLGGAVRLPAVGSKMLQVIPTASYEDPPTKYFATVESKTDRIECLTNELEMLKKEKCDLDSKLTGFQTSSKDLDNLLESQRSDKNKEGLGYSVVPPPPAQVYSPLKKDISWTGLLEFADDTITDYSRPTPAIESNSDDLQNRKPSVAETEASSSTILSKPAIKFVKAVERPTTNKVETVKKPAVKYAEIYGKTLKRSNVRGNQRNWNNMKSQQLGKNFLMKNKACYNYGEFDHLSYDCRKWVEMGKTRPKNNHTHKSMPPRAAVHKTVRSPTRTNRPNINDAQPKRTSFYKPAHSHAQRPFQRESSVRTQSRVPRVSTVCCCCCFLLLDQRQ